MICEDIVEHIRGAPLPKVPGGAAFSTVRVGHL